MLACARVGRRDRIFLPRRRWRDFPIQLPMDALPASFAAFCALAVAVGGAPCVGRGSPGDNRRVDALQRARSTASAACAIARGAVSSARKVPRRSPRSARCSRCRSTRCRSLRCSPSPRSAAIASRVLSAGVIATSLIVGFLVAARLASPIVDAWAKGRSWLLGIAVSGGVLLAFFPGLLAARHAGVDASRAAHDAYR